MVVGVKGGHGAGAGCGPVGVVVVGLWGVATNPTNSWLPPQDTVPPPLPPPSPCPPAAHAPSHSSTHRSCPTLPAPPPAGDQFALFEAITALAMLVRRFDFQRAADAPPGEGPRPGRCTGPEHRPVHHMAGLALDLIAT